MSAEPTASPVAGAAANELEERLVWIFGPARTGGARLLHALKRSDTVTVNDLGLGTHLAPVAWIPDGEYFAHNRNAEHQYYFFAERHMSELGPELAELLLRQLSRQVRALGGVGARWVMVNEPEGHVADSILRLLPRSRMLLLLRDGRDVVAEGARRFADRPPAQRWGFLQRLATQWVQRTAALQRVLATAPESQTLLVRYEEFAADPNGVVRAVWAWLGVDSVAGEGALPDAPVSTASWDTDLDESEWESLMGIMGEKLREVGYGD